MKSRFSTRDMVLTALLIAIGLLIPMVFTGLPFRIVVGPYSATLMAHVPVILAMFISPISAAFAAIGTTVGFFFTATPIIAVRAASHIVFAIVGALLIKNGIKALPLCLITGIIHSLLEGVVVLIFFVGGYNDPNPNYSNLALAMITVIGTLVHHCVDFAIAYAVAKPLEKSKFIHQLPPII